MPGHKRISLLVAAVILAPRLMSAANFAVGTCKPTLKSFSTISAAVASVPPGSTVFVCPGVYPEQVAIFQPLTLQGVQYNNADRAVITVPSFNPFSGGGLQVNVTSQETGVFLGGFFPFAAQVLVETPGPVAINDITVDGTGGDMGCSTSNIWLAAIFYDSGSSGTVNRVTTRQQLDEGCGNGIWAEDTTGPNQTITIVNNSVHDFDYAGIFAGTNGLDQWLTATINGNFVHQGAGSSPFYGSAGIASAFVTGAVGGNVVTGASIGIFNLSSAPLTVISNNSVADTNIGISTGFDGGTIKHNEISNTSTGIDLESNDATATTNLIKNSKVGIEVNCNTDSVSGNNVNDSTIGLENVPASFASSNNFFNVDTIMTKCSF